MIIIIIGEKNQGAEGTLCFQNVFVNGTNLGAFIGIDV